MPVGPIDRAIGFEAIVSEDDQLLRQRSRKWIVCRTNDDPAIESLRNLVSAPHVGVRVIPVSPGSALRDCEHVVVFFTWPDRQERTAVRVGWDVEPVPMDSRGLVQLVFKMNDDVIAFANVERRSGTLSVIC